MPKIRQHIPGYFDGFEPQETDFETLEELLEIDWVKDYLIWEDQKGLHFVRGDDSLLVANEDHTWWWCVGHVTPGSIDSLPKCKYND